jgi:hypothetical protein
LPEKIRNLAVIVDGSKKVNICIGDGEASAFACLRYAAISMAIPP